LDNGLRTNAHFAAMLGVFSEQQKNKKLNCEKLCHPIASQTAKTVGYFVNTQSHSGLLVGYSGRASHLHSGQCHATYIRRSSAPNGLSDLLPADQ
jgi:hypothetical protein